MDDANLAYWFGVVFSALRRGDRDGLRAALGELRAIGVDLRLGRDFCRKLERTRGER